MKIEIVEKNGVRCAVICGSEKIITDVPSALDVLMSAKYEADTKNIVISKQLIMDDFFILSTGLAGEILQKYINYGGRDAVYCEYFHYKKKTLKGFFF